MRYTRRSPGALWAGTAAALRMEATAGDSVAAAGRDATPEASFTTTVTVPPGAGAAPAGGTPQAASATTTPAPTARDPRLPQNRAIANHFLSVPPGGGRFRIMPASVGGFRANGSQDVTVVDVVVQPGKAGNGSRVEATLEGGGAPPVEPVGTRDGEPGRLQQVAELGPGVLHLVIGVDELRLLQAGEAAVGRVQGELAAGTEDAVDLLQHNLALGRSDVLEGLAGVDEVDAGVVEA